MKPQEAHIAIFWDYENCSVPSNLSGYDVVKQIRSLAHEFGSIKLLKAYTQLSEQTMNSSRSFALRSELQSSGVSITDCPHNKFKNVADQMIIVDMLAFAMDNPSGPATVTIMLISGDRDFAYALSTLQLRKYNIVVVAPSTIHASLRAQTSTFFDWDEKILTGAGKYRPTPNFNQHTRDQSSHSSNDATCTVAAKNSYGPSNAPRCTAFGTPAGAFNGSTPYSQNVRSGDSFKKESKPLQSRALADTTTARLEYPLPYSNVLPPSSPTKSHNNRYSHMRAAADKSPPGYSDSNETMRRDLPYEWSFNEVSDVPQFPDSNPHAISGAPNSMLSKQDAADSMVGPSEVGHRNFLPCSSLPSSPSRSRSAEPYFFATTTMRPVSNANTLQSSNTHHPLPRQFNPQTLPVEQPDSTRDVIENGLSTPIPAHTTPGAFPLPTFRSKLPEPSSVPASLPKVIPPHFLLLVQHLEKLRLRGIPHPLRSVLSLALVKMDPLIYKRAECVRFKDFANKAEAVGLIRLGGTDGKAWIGLHPDLHGRIEIPGQVSFLNRP
ncbi:NYN domain-containing protein [Lentinula raphanica]|nr:NYN domain-containing protein [Lentinula raphanica]